MAGETILARVRDQATPTPNIVLVGWMLSAPIVSSVDGLTYQAGVDPITINPLADDSQTIQKRVRDGIAARVTAITGQSFTAADVRGFQAVRTGTVTIASPDGSKTVAFSIAMPRANYKVVPFPRGFAVAIDVANQTVNGFDFTFPAGNVGNIDYLAVED